MKVFQIRLAMIVVVGSITAAQAEPPEGEGWESLFNGRDFSGWEVPGAAEDSWSVVDGVIDCDPRSTEDGSKNLWTTESYGDFKLHVEWRIKEAPTHYAMPLVKPDGTHLQDEEGETIQIARPNADSGIFLRGQPKSQINIWCWPIGSGEVYGYRMDGSQPDEVRSGVTPLVNADKPVGEWNTFVITMEGDRLTVVLNRAKIIDDVPLSEVPESGPIALQYHGGYNHDRGEYGGASSLVQFRNLYIQELD